MPWIAALTIESAGWLRQSETMPDLDPQDSPLAGTQLTLDDIIERCMPAAYRLAIHLTLNWIDDAAILAMMFS